MNPAGTIWSIVFLYGIRSSLGKLSFSNAREESSVFTVVNNIPLDTCRRECQARPQCHSFNYFRASKICQLTSITGSFSDITGTVGGVHGKKADLSDETFDSCNCQSGEQCNIGAGNTTCVVAECQKLAFQGINDINKALSKSKYRISCIQDIDNFDETRTFVEHLHLTCSDDGSWYLPKPSSSQCTFIAAILRPGALADPYFVLERGDNSRTDLECLRSYDCPQNYRNFVIDMWNLLSVSQIRLSIFRNGVEAQYVVFNGTGCNSMDWFAQNRITSSSWTDIMTSTTKYFSISGHVINDHQNMFLRRMFMCKSYGGCDKDSGWLVALHKPIGGSPPCPYENADAFPVYLFSKKNIASEYASECSVYADYIYIVMKLDPPS